MLYFALQQTIDFHRLPVWMEDNQIFKWIYIGDDNFWRIQVEALLPQKIQRISLAADLEKTSWGLRADYLEEIGKLSGRNNTPEWWASELAAKNPSTQMYTKICLLAVACSYMENNPDASILFINSTPALNNELKSFAAKRGIDFRNVNLQGPRTITTDLVHSIKSILEPILKKIPPSIIFGERCDIYRRYLETRNDYRRKVLANKNILELPEISEAKGILIFTWVDHRNFDPTGKYQDPYFGSLPAALKKRGYEITYVPRILFTIPYADAVDRLLKTKERFIFPEQCISSQDVSKCESRIRHYKPLFPDGIFLGSLPVLSLLQEQYEKYRTIQSSTLHYEYIIRHLSKNGLHPQEIIHTCEGHSWEHILKWSVQQYLPGTKVVGFDNLTFSRLTLSMFPAKNELFIRPMPDRIITNGHLYYEVLKNEGLPDDRIRPGCALRHSYMWDSENSDSTPKKTHTDKIIILVATSIDMGETIELCAKTSQAFGGDSSVNVLIKCHPLVDINRVKTILGSQIDHPNIVFVTDPIDKSLAFADVLLYTYTSVCFDALKFGVFPIFIRSENLINLDQLNECPDIHGTATTPDEIRSEVMKFSQMGEKENATRKMKSMEVLKKALSPITDICIEQFLI